jgi:hypothetical protein
MNSWDWTPREAEILEEIHRGREQYAAQSDFDLKRIFADLQEREKSTPGPRATLQPVSPKL